MQADSESYERPYLHDLSLLWHATILILSAVEGLNGFKKLNIKDIDYL